MNTLLIAALYYLGIPTPFVADQCRRAERAADAFERDILGPIRSERRAIQEGGRS